MSTEHPNRQPSQPVVIGESFTSKSILVLVLYFVLYLPGLIGNIVFWNEAQQIKHRAGYTPAGTGCLTAMLVAQGVVVLLLCMLFGVGSITSQ